MSTLKSIIILISTLFLFCIPAPQTISQRPEAPLIEPIKLTINNNQYGNYYMAVYLKWKSPPNDSTTIQYYTLLRKFPGDSVFDIFSLSQRIPAKITEFYDKIEENNFPDDGFDTLFYKAIAIDEFGRFGDTSRACTLVIAPQPLFDTLDIKNGCIKWKSWIRGSQTSFGWFWNDSFDKKWVSPRLEAYPRTDEPAVFEVRIPDSFIKLQTTRLHFAFFLEISDARSISSGFIDKEIK